MKKLKLFFVRKQHHKGQAFMEMAVVSLCLLILLLGMIEFGFLLNQYIVLVDAAREGARFGSNNDPYQITDPVTGNTTEDYSVIQNSFYKNIDLVIDNGTDGEAGAIAPLKFNPNEDDILISFLSIRTGGTYLISGPWHKYPNGKHPTSKLLSDPSFITNSLNTDAPNTGILIVEIFYAYQQRINAPVFTLFIPNPIQVHAYAIMPLTAAEPTPVIAPNPTP